MHTDHFSDRALEQRLHLAKAEKALAQMLSNNARQHWQGIDRTPEAIAFRRRAVAWALGNEALEGHPPPEEDSFFARLLEHQILGDITSAQSIELDHILLGIK